MDLEFKNDLNLPVEVSFYLKDSNSSIGLIDVEGEHKTLIQPNGGTLPIDLSGLNRNFMIYIKMEHIPISDGLEGIKVIPGTGLCDLLGVECHHVECLQLEDH